MRYLLLGWGLVPLVLCSQTSPFNGREIKVNDDESFTFVVGGHFHGASNNLSGFPASTFLGNLDEINASGADFMVSLGDLFLNAEKDIPNYEKSFFDKLQMPLFNAVGNHDVEQFDYEQRFGARYESFIVGANQFIILDTEEETGDIEGGQLTFLKRALKVGAERVFIFGHRPIWAEEDETLSDLFEGNTRSGTNFEDDVLPLLRKASGEVYMFGGSLGGKAPASFFYHEPEKGIHYIATAIRNVPRDALLYVHIDGSKVDFEPVSLTGRRMLPLESYNVKFWQEHGPEEGGFNWRLIPLYMWEMVSHRYFWYGIGWSLLGYFSIWFIRKRRRRRA